MPQLSVMETLRITYRERTKEMMEQLLVLSLADQMTFLGYYDEDQVQAEIEKTHKSLTKIEQIVWFDLIEKESNTVIGSCGFHNWVKEHLRAELGYYLHPNYREKGYMIEATEKVLAYGFKKMNLIRIEAFIDPNNGPSIGIMNRFSFKKKGVLRDHYIGSDKVYDSVIYSLLLPEFKEKM